MRLAEKVEKSPWMKTLVLKTLNSRDRVHQWNHVLVYQFNCSQMPLLKSTLLGPNHSYKCNNVLLHILETGSGMILSDSVRLLLHVIWTSLHWDRWLASRIGSQDWFHRAFSPWSVKLKVNLLGKTKVQITRKGRSRDAEGRPSLGKEMSETSWILPPSRVTEGTSLVNRQ